MSAGLPRLATLMMRLPTFNAPATACAIASAFARKPPRVVVLASLSTANAERAALLTLCEVVTPSEHESYRSPVVSTHP